MAPNEVQFGSQWNVKLYSQSKFNLIQQDSKIYFMWVQKYWIRSILYYFDEDSASYPRQNTRWNVSVQ